MSLLSSHFMFREGGSNSDNLVSRYPESLFKKTAYHTHDLKTKGLINPYAQKTVY